MLDTSVIRSSLFLRKSFVSICLAAFALSFAVLAAGQEQPAPSGSSQPNQQEAPPEAGGPQSDIGPMAIPKKKEEPAPPPPTRPQKRAGRAE
jgi:hypothetical protein